MRAYSQDLRDKVINKYKEKAMMMVGNIEVIWDLL